MKRSYLDSSAWIARFNPGDEFCRALDDWWVKSDSERVFTPPARQELRHQLRRIRDEHDAATAWQAYRAAEKSALLLMDRAFAWQRVLDRADEISDRHAAGRVAGTWDFVHVASALVLRCDELVTCDVAQAEIAEIAGLDVALLKVPKK